MAVNVLCEVEESGREQGMIEVSRDEDEGLWELGHGEGGVHREHDHVTQFTGQIEGPYADC